MVKQIVFIAFAVSAFAINADPQTHAEKRLTAAVESTPARDLVSAEVDETRTKRLLNHRAAWAVSENESGSVPDDIALQQLSVELNRTVDRERAFQQLLADQQNPMSPKFHQWLTPVEIGERYGASQHDIDAVARWLTTQGLTGVLVANSRTRITFNGTAGAVSKAFKTRLSYFTVRSERRIGNADDPQVPAALAPVVRSVRGLTTERYYPQHTSRSGVFHHQPYSSQPDFTNCSGSVCDHVIFPADFATIFNIQSTLSQGIAGNGQSIAIVGRARVNSADLQNFMQLTGVTFALPNVIVPPTGIDPGPAATTCTTTGTVGSPGTELEFAL